MTGRREGPDVCSDGPTPPTVVALHPEHGGGVGWDKSPGVPGVRGVDPAELDLPACLTARLATWDQRWQEMSNRWLNGEPDTPDSDRAMDQWRRDGLDLAHDLEHALGRDVEVRYEGRAVGDRRGP